jgi:hypothetical protein
MSDKVFPIAPVDARFHDVNLDEQATSRSAWESVEAEVLAMPSTPASLPRVDIEYAGSQIIALYPTLATLRAPTLALLSDDRAQQTAQAIDSLPRWSFAMLYVMQQERTESPDGVSITDLNTEGMALRGDGLDWCQILERLGFIKAGTTSAIKKGVHSHRETIADLQDIYKALSPHRATITALTNLPGSTTQPISDADIDRMERVATIMRQALNRAPGALPWRESLLRVAAHVRRSYKVASASILFLNSLERIDSDDEAKASVPKFGAFRRRAPKPKAPPTTPNPATPPAP